MNYDGIIIGAIAFIIIGIFHPIIIKGEYYFGKRVWPVFLIVGITLLGLSFLIREMIFSATLGVTGFSCLWSIHEIIEQEERVKKGWFPSNPQKNK